MVEHSFSAQFSDCTTHQRLWIVFVYQWNMSVLSEFGWSNSSASSGMEQPIPRPPETQSNLPRSFSPPNLTQPNPICTWRGRLRFYLFLFISRTFFYLTFISVIREKWKMVSYVSWWMPEFGNLNPGSGVIKCLLPNESGADNSRITGESEKQRRERERERKRLLFHSSILIIRSTIRALTT